MSDIIDLDAERAARRGEQQPGEPEETPDPGPTEYDPLAELAQANLDKIQQLEREGMALSPFAILKLRQDLLTQLLLPRGGAFRTNYEIFYEQNLASMLDEALVEGRRAKLTQGVGVEPPRGIA